MKIYNYTWTVIWVCLVNYRFIDGRKVAALDDICARGTYSFCPSQAAQQSAPLAISRDLPQPRQSSSNNGQPRTPFSETPPPLPTVADYCKKYAEHYGYYCSGANSKDPKAGDFCPTYLNYCGDAPVGTGPAGSPQPSTPAPELPPAKIQQICTDYQPVANLYCFRPQIPKEWSVKKNCDLYLKYCVATATNQLQQQNKTLKQVLKENVQPCQKFENDYVGFCVQNPKPYNNQVAEFCRNYKSTCVPMQVPTGENLLATSSLAQVQPQPQIQQLQPQMPVQQMQPQVQPVLQPQMQPQVQPQVQPQLQPQAASPPQLGNPNIITDPLGSLGGPPNPSIMGNPGAQMVRNMQGGGPVPVDASGNPLSGMAANPLAFGSQTAVGNIAGVSRGTAINPFGHIASGTNVQGGPVGVQSGSGVDFSGIPGLGQLGSIPGLGRRRRKRQLSLLMRVLQKL